MQRSQGLGSGAKQVVGELQLNNRNPLKQQFVGNTPARPGSMRLKVRAGAPLYLAAGTVAAAAAIGTAMVRKVIKLQPRVLSQSNEWNERILKLCPHLTAPYELPSILNNGHVETIFAALMRRRPHVLYDRELVHMPDGGVVALDTEDLSESQQLPADAPVLILLPGLTGGSEDSYVQHAVVHARQAGIRAVVFNSRGTSSSPVTTPQFYSASFTEDLRCVVKHVAASTPEGVPLFAAGWSLGANILTRYLGEEGENTPLTAAVAMCNPFNLPLSDANFKKGFNRIYDWNLARSLRRIYSRHHSKFDEAAAKGIKPFKPELALNAKTIRDFDEAITAVAFNWPSVDDYYAGSSSSLSIPKVTIPLLVVQAEDDPIAPREAIPFDEIKANPNCTLVVTPTGGHLGWCSGNDGVLGAPWTDKAVIEYLEAVQKLKVTQKHAMLEPAGVFTEGRTTHQAP